METKRSGSSFNAMSSKRELESVFLFTTGKCNAKCAMCFYAGDMDKKAPELTFEQIKKLSESAGSFKRLWLSGGEPTLREDLPEIIELFYRNNHVQDINLPSNGIKNDLLVRWVHRLRQSCPEANITVSISMDGFGATHDKQRGVPSFYKAVECLKKLDRDFKGDGHVLKNIGTVITKYNVDEITDFVAWVYGRLNLTTHTIEAARGVTREEGVKILNEKSLREIQDQVAPYYMLYANRIGEGMNGIGKLISKYFYVGLMRTLYNIRASNMDHPNPWNMDCTAGETTLVIDYDGRFRACELRDPIGMVQDYDCDIQKIIHGDAMRKEIETIGHGYRANCWCTHGCWIMSSITFNPGKMIRYIVKNYGENKRISARNPVRIDEAMLQRLEDKYHLDTEKLAEIGIRAPLANAAAL